MTHYQPSSSATLPPTSTETTGQLLAGVTRIADDEPELAGRRSELLKLLIELTGAAAATWDWGVAEDSAQLVLTRCDRRTRILRRRENGDTENGIGSFHAGRISHAPHGKKYRNERRNWVRRCGRICTTTTSWKKTRMHANLSVGQFDEWIHSVRYSDSVTWSSLFSGASLRSRAFPSD